MTQQIVITKNKDGSYKVAFMGNGITTLTVWAENEDSVLIIIKANLPLLESVSNDL